VSGLLRGYTQPSSKTETFVGPKGKDYYQLSDLNKLSATLATMGGIANGSGLDTIQNKTKGILDYLMGKMTSPGSTDSSSSGFTPEINFGNQYAGQNEEGVSVFYDTTTGQYYDIDGNIVPLSGE
jgi:hypothetical protein